MRNTRTNALNANTLGTRGTQTLLLCVVVCSEHEQGTDRQRDTDCIKAVARSHQQDGQSGETCHHKRKLTRSARSLWHITAQAGVRQEAWGTLVSCGLSPAFARRRTGRLPQRETGGSIDNRWRRYGLGECRQLTAPFADRRSQDLIQPRPPLFGRRPKRSPGFPWML